MEQDNIFFEFFEKYQDATRRISKKFWEIKRFGAPDAKLKERVYCYELYHQIRCMWKDSSDYVLHGEMDKIDHSILNGIPDFILHKPESMESNLAVIEVKHSDNSAITDDIVKLHNYMLTGRYTYSICHVFGTLSEKRLRSFIRILVPNQYFVYHNVKENEVRVLQIE
ncbi:hypothetical protein GC093_16900 [Paenibacillus sp. LMG 31456]|uniref:NERD domain-containing protein n=1 Tax=Paenibacillus foliorum TaxID=2654974 RepID=A0A972GQE4_9BACL|nr:hypothetical protein [Paenibacillus foliorum]NOU94887.1 hypothetical protein [Paenibacillus foliorum]